MDNHATRGALVPTAFRGTVASVHREAVNVSVSDDSGDYVVSLIRNAAHWTELAIAVADRYWPAITGARPSDPIALRSDGCLLVSNQAGPITVTAARSPQPVALESIRSGVLAEVSNTLVARHHSRGFVALLAPDTTGDRFAQRAAVRIAAWRPDDTTPLTALVGLGAGFTPSGDDFLSGVLLAERLSGTALADHDTIRQVLPTTAPAGSSLLRVALAGYPPAYQLRIVQALLQADGAAALAEAEVHGHSSGLDALAGVLWGLHVAESHSTMKRDWQDSQTGKVPQLALGQSRETI